MSKFKLRELSPVIISVIILTIAIIGLARAAGGSIGGLFLTRDSIGWDYNLGNSTSSGYRLDAQNIFPTIFGSTKTIEAGSGVFSNKVTSADTISTDSSGTLTTKGYVENFANNAATTAANNAKDNLGNHIATQDLNMSGSGIINLATPINSNDATTKTYVDNAIAGALAGGGGGIITTTDIIINNVAGNYTWIAPENIKFITVIGCGGGGGKSDQNNSGGGGGCAEITAKVTPGKTYSYTVGAGGYTLGRDLVNGDNSYFNNCIIGGGGGSVKHQPSRGTLTGGIGGTPFNGYTPCPGSIGLSSGKPGFYPSTAYRTQYLGKYGYMDTWFNYYKYNNSFGIGGIGKYGCNGGNAASILSNAKYKGYLNRLHIIKIGEPGCIVIKQYLDIPTPTNIL